MTEASGCTKGDEELRRLCRWHHPCEPFVSPQPMLLEVDPGGLCTCLCGWAWRALLTVCTSTPCPSSRRRKGDHFPAPVQLDDAARNGDHFPASMLLSLQKPC
eukprot:1152641-Pelagomonas_calceolata.AAC.3